jgi:hypothetical protein
MENFFQDVKDTFIARINNLFIVNFLISWVIFNYDIVVIILFSDISIENKILFWQYLPTDYYYHYVYPLGLALIYIYFLPLVNLGLNFLYDKFINVHIRKYKNKLLSDYYINKRDVEEIKLKNTVFVQNELENELKKKSLDLDTQRVAVESSLNNEKEEKIKLDKTLIIQRKNTVSILDRRNNIFDLIKRIDELETQIRGHERNIKSLKKNQKDNIEFTFDDPVTPESKDRLVNPNRFIILPKVATNIPLEIPSFKNSENNYNSINEFSDHMGHLLVLINVIDERFVLMHYNLENEESLLIACLEKNGYKNITEVKDTTDYSNLSGDEFMLVDYKKMSTFQNKINYFLNDLYIDM